MKNIFRRKRAKTWAEVLRLEEEVGHDRSDKADTLNGLFDQYGANRSESRVMGSGLRKAVELARDEGRWAEVIPVFRDERTRQPDYDVPHMWPAGFLEHEGRTQSAINLAENAAKQCRRKSELLEQAAEFALFSDQVGDSRRGPSDATSGFSVHGRVVSRVRRR